MVLSYYIATQTVEHLRFLSFFFFVFFLKNKMQHIPVVSHALWRGTFILKMLDVVPTIQTTGSFHRQDLFIYSGEEPHRTRGWREEVSVTETEVFPVVSVVEGYLNMLSIGISSLTGTWLSLPQSVYPSPQPLHTSWSSLQAAFSHAVVWPGAWQTDRQMDGKVKTSYLMQTIPLRYWIIIPQWKIYVTVTSRGLFSILGCLGKYSVKTLEA